MNIAPRFYFVFIIVLVVAILVGCVSSRSNNLHISDDVAAPPATLSSDIRYQNISQFRSEPDQNYKIRVPLYFWIVTSTFIPDISYKVSDVELQAYVDGANLIWAGADVNFFIKQVNRISLDAHLSEQYATFLSGNLTNKSVPRKIVADSGQYNPTFGNFNIVLLKAFGHASGTAFLKKSVIYLAESNKAKEIRRPTILAHELGHALGLRHIERANWECNLMDTGPCGAFNDTYTSEGILVKSLHPCQVAIARSSANTGFVLRTYPESVTCFHQ